MSRPYEIGVFLAIAGSVLALNSAHADDIAEPVPHLTHHDQPPAIDDLASVLDETLLDDLSSQRVFGGDAHLAEQFERLTVTSDDGLDLWASRKPPFPLALSKGDPHTSPVTSANDAASTNPASFEWGNPLGSIFWAAVGLVNAYLLWRGGRWLLTWWRRSRKREPLYGPNERVTHMRCPRCGYDLFGSDSSRCPECGLLAPWIPRRPPRRLRNEFVVVGLFGVLAASGVAFCTAPWGSWTGLQAGTVRFACALVASSVLWFGLGWVLLCRSYRKRRPFRTAGTPVFDNAQDWDPAAQLGQLEGTASANRTVQGMLSARQAPGRSP